MFLLKRWTAFMSTLSILDERNPSEYVNTVDTGSSGIRNVSTQKMNCLHVDTVDTNREWIWSKDTGSSGIRNVSTQKMNCLHVYTVDTGWKESIRICQHWIQVHLVFEMFLLKRWTAFMSTLSIQIQVTGSSGIRNVSTQKMNCLHVDVYTVDTGWKESIWICQHCRYRFIWYSKCFYSKDELPSCRHCRYTSRMDSKQIYEFHPVFEMYYWRQRACRHCRYKVVWVENLQYWMKGIHPNMSTLSIQGCLSRKSSIQHCWYRFIWYSKCFYSKDELPSCQHCRYWMKGIHLNMSTLSIQVHLVFEMFLLKRWTAFMSTLSIQIENGFEYAKIQVHLVFEMFLQKMNCLHVYTVDTGWKESIRICQHCRYRFIWYSKCFYSKDELPSCRHCRYKSRMDSKDVHLVFEMFLLKRWTAFMSTLSDERNPSEYVNTVDTGSSGIRNVSTQKMNCLHVDTVDTNREWIRSKDTGSSGIRNVSTQKMNCLHVYTVDTGWKESIRICQHCWYRFIWYSKCFYSKDELPSCRHCRYKSRMDSKQRYRFIWYSKCFYSKDELSSCLHCRYWMKGIHPNMSTLSIQVHLVFEMFLLKRWTAFMSTLSILDERNPSEYVNTVDTGSSGIRNVSTQKMNCLHVDTVDTHREWIQSKYTSFIQYSKCTIEDREHVDTVDTRLFE